jgi:putative ABC transport system permease protein
MWKVTLKGILSHKIRFLLTGVAVVLGVAFISGTLVLTATISKTFDGLFTDIYAHTDAVVREKAAFKQDFGAGRGNVPGSVLPLVKQTRGVAGAAGTVDGLAVIIKKNGDAYHFGQGPPNIGSAWNPVAALRTFTIASGHAPEAPNQIVIDKKSADDTGYSLGDQVPVQTKTVAEYELVGTVKFGDQDSALGSTAVLFTPATAARVLGTPGEFTSIDVKADPGVSQDEVVRNLEQSLASEPNIEVLSGKAIATESQNDIKDALGFFNTFLLVFGVVALLVGSFVIFNTFSIIVAQRGREMALLRAIGARGAQVVRSVLLEALLVGVVASILGFLGGILLAGLIKLALAAGGIDIPATEITVPSNAVVASFAVGIVVTVVSAVFPAIRASRVPPIAALSGVSTDKSAHSVPRIVSGAVITAIGLVFLLSGLFGGGDNALPSVGFGAFVIFVGVAILGPVFARPLSSLLGWPVRRIKGVTGLLARENARRNPARTSATAAALMIGVALVGLITVFGASARASVASAIDESMKADYIVTSGGFGIGALPPELAQKLREVPGVEQVSGVQSGAMKVKGSVDQMIGVDPEVVDSLFDLEVSKGDLRALGTDGIAVQEHTADDKSLKVGDRVPVEFAATGKHEFVVRAIYDQTGITPYVISTAAYTDNFPTVFDAQIYMKTAGGPTAANRAAIHQVVKQYPTGKLQDQEQFKASQSQQINQFLNLVYGLLLFAIVIALFGIANTLGLSIVERTRELGLMRAVGMTRRQVRSIVRWESVIIALLGALLGIVIGVFFAWCMVNALSDQGFNTFTAAPGSLVVIFVLAAIFGVVAAILPARRAAKLDVLQAISTE